MPWTASDAAYMAGIIDGEGSITIFPYVASRRGEEKCIRYKPIISVSNTSYPLLEWILKRFGGNIRRVKRKRDEGLRWKTCFHWERTHSKALEIINAVEPFLVVKREQAWIFKDFVRTMKKGGNKGTPAGILGQRKVMSDKIRFLNRRGIDGPVDSGRRGETHEESNVA